MIRGAHFSNATSAGVFAAAMDGVPSYVDTNVGFRCAFANAH